MQGSVTSVTISDMQQQPFQSQYNPGPGQQQPPMTYGGMPVGQPKQKMNILLIPFITTIIFLIAAFGFGIWAYMGMQDYKNNVQPKIDNAVTLAQQEVSSAKDKEFIEREKIPVKTYTAPQTAGSLVIKYPKTWSSFVTEKSTGTSIVEGYFHPNYVPGLDSGTDFALRIKVLSRSYDQEMKQFEGKVKSGKLKISPYKAPKMAEGAVGSRIEGEINTGQQDTMVMFPLRDKTISVSTESAQFVGDLDRIILANLTFVP